MSNFNQIYNVGRVVLQFRDDWTADGEYLPLDTVTHRGCSFVCKKANIGHEPNLAASDEYWMILAKPSDPLYYRVVDGSMGPSQDSISLGSIETLSGTECRIPVSPALGNLIGQSHVTINNPDVSLFICTHSDNVIHLCRVGNDTESFTITINYPGYNQYSKQYSWSYYQGVNE